MFKLEQEYLTYTGGGFTNLHIIEELEDIAQHMGLNPDITLETNDNGNGCGYISGHVVTFEEHGYCFLKFKVWVEL